MAPNTMHSSTDLQNFNNELQVATKTNDGNTNAASAVMASAARIPRNLSRETLAELGKREQTDYSVGVTKQNQLRVSHCLLKESRLVTTCSIPHTNKTLATIHTIQPLHCAAQQYAWGRMGSSSTVARMKEAQAVQEDDDCFAVDESKPYAELWLGTHPNGMSMVTVHKELQHGASYSDDSDEDNGGVEVVADRCSLLDYVKGNPTMHCGQATSQDLSFLLKILSVRTVLSIQAHPDKKLAERLHAERPDVYKDPNHKPEMAIALSEKVRAMCGFRPLPEIAQHLVEYPEFRDLLGPAVSDEIERLQHSPATRAVLQHMFHGYLEADADTIHKHVEQMVARLRTMDELNDLQKLILQLEEQFPGDCGIFAPLIFNIVELNKGEALFIDANEPHAYISGEILECMACSDNVVRAGLTPKLKDVPTLVNMLTYDTDAPNISKGQAVDKYTIRYAPPVPDFCVETIHVPAGEMYELSDVQSPSVILTMDGEASLKQAGVCSLDVSYGSAAFCSANTRCTVIAGPAGIRLTRAFNNVFHDEFKYQGINF
jgi:mannose-6-phosphate isomerase